MFQAELVSFAGSIGVSFSNGVVIGSDSTTAKWIFPASVYFVEAISRGTYSP